MIQSREPLIIPYKVKWKTFTPILLLLLMSIVMFFVCLAGGEGAVFPGILSVIFFFPVFSALLRSGKPFITYGPESFQCPILPRELDIRIYYRDIEAVWVVSQQGMSYLCLQLRNPGRVLAPLPANRKLYYQQGCQNGRGDIYLSVGGLAADPDYLRDELRARLPQEAPQV